MSTDTFPEKQILYNKHVFTSDGIAGLLLFQLLKLRKNFKSENVYTIRTQMEKQAAKVLAPPKKSVLIKDEIAGVPVGWINADVNQKKVVVYLHGGAYVAGSVNTHAGIAANLNSFCGVPFLLIDYGLAPENTFPRALQQVIIVYRELLNSGYSGKNIAIAGDSAGGGLVMGFLQYCRDERIEHVCCAALICPWLDVDNTSASFGMQHTDPMLSKNYLDKCARLYVGDLDEPEKYLYPLRNSMAGLPPLYIHTAGFDVLQDDGKKLFELAQKENVPVYWYHHHKNFHVYHMFWKYLKSAKAANSLIAAFFTQHLKN